MHKEMQVRHDQNTLRFGNRGTVWQKLINCCWDFKMKPVFRATTKQHKALLVAKDFQQGCSVDFNQIFALVAVQLSIRLLLALLHTRGQRVLQAHVNSAFLQGYLHNEIYMRQPDGFVDSRHPHIGC